MIDVPTAALYFGFPLSVVLLCWVGVKLHEHNSPKVTLESEVHKGASAASENRATKRATWPAVARAKQRSGESDPPRPIWQMAPRQFERGLQWLTLRPQVQATLFSVGMGIVAVLLLVFSSVTAAVAAVAAWIALMRHFAQTNADRQRRITESFAKAVEQLGSDKLEVRLGGIYSLERISKESPDDYWTVMENLTAFVRERSRRNEAERMSTDVEQRRSRRAHLLWQEAGRPDGRAEEFWAEAVKQDEFGEPPATDIAAVLTVIKRRNERSRERESSNAWRLDFSGAILKQADLAHTHLERAILAGAHLEQANLWGAHLEEALLFGAHLEGAKLGSGDLEGVGAHLEGAQLWGAHLEGAQVGGAHLEGASLPDAHLDGANLVGVHLQGALLWEAHLEGAELRDAHLEGATLLAARGLSEGQIRDALGDAKTKLPPGIARPAHWPPSARPK